MCFALFVAWLLALLPGMGLLLICFACCGVNAVLCAGFAIVGNWLCVFGGIGFMSECGLCLFWLQWLAFMGLCGGLCVLIDFKGLFGA